MPNPRRVQKQRICNRCRRQKMHTETIINYELESLYKNIFNNSHSRSNRIGGLLVFLPAEYSAKHKFSFIRPERNANRQRKIFRGNRRVEPADRRTDFLLFY